MTSSLTCMTCRRVSYHPEDVRNLYCGFCKDFVDRSKAMITPPDLGFDPCAKAYVLQVTDQWIVAMMPMLFNDRVLLSSIQDWRQGISWTAGWCYDKGGAAGLAAVIYDPDRDLEPVGYKKLAFDTR